MSENGEIYTAGKNFTLPPAVTGGINSTSAKLVKYDTLCWWFSAETMVLQAGQGRRSSPSLKTRVEKDKAARSCAKTRHAPLHSTWLLGERLKKRGKERWHQTVYCCVKTWSTAVPGRPVRFENTADLRKEEETQNSQIIVIWICAFSFLHVCDLKTI